MTMTHDQARKRKAGNTEPPAGMTFATAADLLAVQPDYEDIHLPSIGKWVRVRGLSLGEKDAIEAESVTYDRKTGKVAEFDFLTNLRSRYIVRSLITPDGNRMFNDKQVSVVSKLPAADFEKIFATIQRLSAVSDADIAELAGNSEGGAAEEPPIESQESTE